MLRTHHASDVVVDALGRRFADATRATMIGATLFLLLGFFAATRIPLRAGRTPDGAQGAEREAAVEADSDDDVAPNPPAEPRHR